MHFLKPTSPKLRYEVPIGLHLPSETTYREILRSAQAAGLYIGGPLEAVRQLKDLVGARVRTLGKDCRAQYFLMCNMDQWIVISFWFCVVGLI